MYLPNDGLSWLCCGCQMTQAGALGEGAVGVSVGLPGSWVPVQIAGATRMVVDSEAVAQELLRRAARARSTDSTAMNSESSRSHSVFTLHITGVNEAGDCRLLGSLSLVDLAGSERLARSGAEGQRQKETCAINKSLSSLGDIFQVRRAGSGRAGDRGRVRIRC